MKNETTESTPRTAANKLRYAHDLISRPCAGNPVDQEAAVVVDALREITAVIEFLES